MLERAELTQLLQPSSCSLATSCGTDQGPKQQGAVLMDCSTLLNHHSVPYLRSNTVCPQGRLPSGPGGRPSCLLAKGGTASAPHKLCLTAETETKNPILAWKLQRHRAQINTQASRTLLPEGKGARTAQGTSPISTGDPLSLSPCRAISSPQAKPPSATPALLSLGQSWEMPLLLLPPQRLEVLDKGGERGLPDGHKGRIPSQPCCFSAGNFY